MDPELISVVQRFLVSEVTDIRPLPGGHIHDSYIVTAASGGLVRRYVLQRLNQTVFADVDALMENVQRVIGHIRKRLLGSGESHRSRRGMSLVPLSAACNAYLYRQDGECWRMFEFVKGTRTLHEVRSAADAERLGRAFGEFHDLMADLPPPRLHETIPRFHDTPWRLVRFEQSVAADVCGRAGGIRAEIEFIRAHAGLAPLLLEANVPQRVVHNDAKIGNVLFDESTGEVLCVVDLDTVMPGTILFDFGDMVRSGVCTAAEDETDLSRVEVELSLFEALTRGYLGAARALLTAGEREYLVTAGKVIVFEQAVRYLTDFLEGDRYYKTSRPGHNLDRCRTQVGLVESIARNEREMKRIVRGV